MTALLAADLVVAVGLLAAGAGWLAHWIIAEYR